LLKAHNILCVDTDFIFERIRTFRELQGLTQQELARKSRVSVPMIQLIEAKKANPSIEVLARIFKVLGIDFKFHNEMDPREQLALYFGLLTSKAVSQIRALNPERLSRWIAMVGRLEDAPPDYNGRTDERTQEAWDAILLAIVEYYPSYFKSLGVARPIEVTGRVIKLKRMAVGPLVEVMNS